MSINRSNVVNKQSVSLLAVALIIFLSSSCAAQKAQKSSERNVQSSQAEPRSNRTGCKSSAETDDIKQPTEWKGSDLQHAVLQKDVKAVKKLLQQNVDVEEKDNYGRTALLYALTPKVREPELTPPGEARQRKTLREEQALQRKALQEEQAQIEITRELLAHGANPNQRNGYGETPLINAAGFGYNSSHAVKLLTLLIQYKADVNLQDERGFSALMEAARNNEPEAVKFLLARGADAKLTNCDGQTALSIAETGKSADVVRLLKQP